MHSFVIDMTNKIISKYSVQLLIIITKKKINITTELVKKNYIFHRNKINNYL